ncbi:MAG TPA: AAA family ATPase [Candidatus Limivivens intestinipullorum]|uniref:AAA family ATPase n=1 Tax=Candidatus Limivivens intestinipullorum TaxID=2840858 RepID=A0A9D1JJL7_9FIRM|nr:AAA family ATPase [Candidatus Limivivens intestinipullorum]
MPQRISLGAQDFEYIRSNHCFYVDKTCFIKEWWENRDVVTLITRPRRFGKTLNMCMLEQFFSVQYKGRTDLFEGLDIWKEEPYRDIQGTWPVIFLSFAGIKGEDYQTARGGIIQKILDLYGEYRFLQESDVLNVQERAYFDYVKPDMADEVAALALQRLAICMNRYYGRKTLIFLDEYDTPLQEAYLNGYWKEMTGFIRGLFNNTFKTNRYMERGVLTGITRVSKESVFSDLNNLSVVTTTSEKYASCFGFTEQEVFDALDRYGLSEQKKNVKEWYDGFVFGSRRDIYNPWSITSFLSEKELSAYWANTSFNALAGKLIQTGPPSIKIAMEDLLAGKTIQTQIDEKIIFQQLDNNVTAIWSLFLASGYLKVEKRILEQGVKTYFLSWTNFEVKLMFRKMIDGWFKEIPGRYNEFITALLTGDVVYMNEYMNDITRKTFSSFDVGKKPSEKAEPERFYHGFVLGLIVDASLEYRITSNRESGLGRYDVVMEPLKPGNPAFVLEFKVRKPTEKNLEETVANALAQIKEKNYDAELTARGIPKEQIRHYGFAFEGEKVLIG